MTTPETCIFSSLTLSAPQMSLLYVKPFASTCCAPCPVHVHAAVLHCCTPDDKNNSKTEMMDVNDPRSTSPLPRSRRRQSTTGSIEEARTWSKSRCVCTCCMVYPATVDVCLVFSIYRKVGKNGILLMIMFLRNEVFPLFTLSRPLSPPPSSSPFSASSFCTGTVHRLLAKL